LRKKISIVFLLLLAAAILFLSQATPARFATGYYHAERWIAFHWPTDAHRWDIEKIAPYLVRARLLKPARTQVEPGMSLWLDPGDLVAKDIFRSGVWQPEVWEALRPSLGEGHVLIDVGAHIGYFTLKGAQNVGSTGRVVAFEPNPETLEVLRANLEASHAANVEVAPVAATDRESSLTFYAAAHDNTGRSSLALLNAGDGSHQYNVRGRPIDAVLDELKIGRVDAIKIDVEGAEVQVLRGAAHTLRRFHPLIVTEVDTRQLRSLGASPEELASVLRDAGYNHARPLNPDFRDWEWRQVPESDLLTKIDAQDPRAWGQMLSGFHGFDNGTTRAPVDQDFEVLLRRPTPGSLWLILRLIATGDVTIIATANSSNLPTAHFTAGEQVYRQQIPPGNNLVKVRFQLNSPARILQIALEN
jgi:FkbM family methyltransferase